MDSLTDHDAAILDLESRWWATAGGKENAIRAMGLTPTRYYQLLQRLLATEQAMAYAAGTVNRLQRISTDNGRSARPRLRFADALHGGNSGGGGSVDHDTDRFG